MSINFHDKEVVNGKYKRVNVKHYGRAVENMRKVIFTIDDLAWMHKYYNLTEEQMKDIFNDKKSSTVLTNIFT